MNKPRPSLRLARSTVRQLTDHQLEVVVGGTLADGSNERAPCGATQKLPPPKEPALGSE